MILVINQLSIGILTCLVTSRQHVQSSFTLVLKDLAMASKRMEKKMMKFSSLLHLQIMISTSAHNIPYQMSLRPKHSSMNSTSPSPLIKLLAQISKLMKRSIQETPSASL